MRATIQLCTYNRAALLERVLDGCFEQDAGPQTYEVVLVNDGSTDGTRAVIEAARKRAACAFTVIDQVNAGLARGRNAGIAAARGARIIFIDDDVLPMPNFVSEHLRSAERDANAVVRGAVINVESFDALPPPRWSLANYSANWFWTSNVSVSRRRLDQVGWFDETFSEYGWEDIELGLRLRAAGTRGTFNRLAVAFHHKPAGRFTDVEAMRRQARAQARTAALLARKHPGWRVALATGDNAVQRGLHRVSRRLALERRWESLAPQGPAEAPNALQTLAARALAGDAYFDELERAR